MELLKENISQFRTPAIRDLVWVLCSPCPLNEVSGLPLFTDAAKLKWYTSHFSLLEAWDKAPETFLKHLNDFTKNHRLGYYFEALMHTFFHLSPSIEVVIANHQIIRDKQTLGEIDFILQEGEEIYHLELAIKYYLQFQNEDDFSTWLGPNGKDSLSKKIKKLKSHQLQLTKHLEAYQNIASRALICGQFYQNNQRVVWQNTNALLKPYMKQSDFIKGDFDAHVEAYYLLTKPHWLSATVVPDESLRLDGKDELVEKMKESFAQKKAVHVGLLYAKGYTSIVLVPDAWPTLP
ncbi:DUF1853 family protein [Lishizhenia sp.]|uniref:DUF1853 family protein n=1 Tax=Lishizhenia sp. TaxID=2497594 RepID=UPI00299EBEDE|nr:DUF1853 family protein [Lishizhenia sp.]MDX1446892.1 DUF1853 family protein [Lishizhenia sp.]